MKHIINFSGGKDSTAMTLKMLEDGWWVDEIIFADTGKDFPQMIGHINKFDDYIQNILELLMMNQKELGIKDTHWLNMK